MSSRPNLRKVLTSGIRKVFLLRGILHFKPAYRSDVARVMNNLRAAFNKKDAKGEFIYDFPEVQGRAEGDRYAAVIHDFKCELNTAWKVEDIRKSSRDVLLCFLLVAEIYSMNLKVTPVERVAGLDAHDLISSETVDSNMEGFCREDSKKRSSKRYTKNVGKSTREFSEELVDRFKRNLSAPVRQAGSFSFEALLPLLRDFIYKDIHQVADGNLFKARKQCWNDLIHIILLKAVQDNNVIMDDALRKIEDWWASSSDNFVGGFYKLKITEQEFLELKEKIVKFEVALFKTTLEAISLEDLTRMFQEQYPTIEPPM